MKIHCKKILSLLLAICMLLTLSPVTPVTAEETATTTNETTLSTTEEIIETDALSAAPAIDLTADCAILNYVDEEVFGAGNHVLRLAEEETLSSYVFLNADGTKTVYYLDEAVKFVDSDGTVREKDLSLTLTDTGYTTESNNIDLTIPADPAKGITILWNGHAVRIIPQGGTLSDTVLDGNSIRYTDYYGEGADLVYTPTLTGVKEDIVLESYTGQNTFTFMLNTGGLNLYSLNGRYYLAESKTATDRIELGDLVTFDANGRFSVGTMTSQTITAGNIYRLTLTVDAEFLTDESTVYPLSTAPTIRISDDTTVGDIEDVNIYEGTPNATANWSYMHLGYYDDTYQTGRILVRLTGLLNDSEYQAMAASQIVSAHFYLKEATGLSAANINLYPHRGNSNWTESSVTWNTAGHTVGDLVTTVSHPRNDWGCYDITSLILDWKNGTNNPNSGFVLRHSSEDTKTKGFYSSEYTSNTDYRPYFVLTYNEIVPEVYITSTQNDVDERAELPLTAITSPGGQEITWTTSNSHVASVDDGTVTGNYAGKVTVTATLSNGASDSYTVYVTVADSYYYIENAASGYCLNNYNSSSASTGTYLDTKDMTSSNHAFEVWIIKHIADGKYIIRPMSRRISCLTKDSGSNAIVKDYNIADTFSAVPLAASWTIGHNSFGYYLRSNGAESATLQPVNASELESNIVTGAWTASLNCHWELNEAYGAYFRNRASQRTVSEDSIKYIEMGSSISYSALGYDLVIYKSVMGMQWTSSNPSVIGIHYGSGSMTINGVGLTTISVHVTINGVVYVASFSVYVYPELSGYELAYEPGGWNSEYVTYMPESFVYEYTNCYAYVLNNQIDPAGNSFGCNSIEYSDPRYRMQQPGQFYNNNLYEGEPALNVGLYIYDLSILVTAVTKDYQKYNQIYGTSLIFEQLDGITDTCPAGTYRVALYFNPSNGDYHWYRQNSDGTWSHKMGLTPVTDKTYYTLTEVIYHPDDAAAARGYTTLVGYFAMSPWNNYYVSSDTAAVENCVITTTTLPNNSIQMDCIALIEIGMSIDEVIEILGCSGINIGSGTIIHQYATIESQIITISYAMDSNGIYRVVKMQGDGVVVE